MPNHKNKDTEVTTPEAEKHILRQLSEPVSRVFIAMRKEKGYTSYESFAFDVDFPRAQYWRVETGRHNLTLRTLARLLAIHDVPVVQFLRHVIAEHEAMYPPSKMAGRPSKE
ncbi:hypothetical protein [Dawidia soli]|uniref:HTH cro/C1-type domain-containing protein n=1 Tax=Dawidia soli TaxID=2782352 RepID=A0AAP2DEV2_9BACT|nr:hypothetical protein [Dawidia soli]MBT1689425.1 hypothetical protein [Dawidia soli]